MKSIKKTQHSPAKAKKLGTQEFFPRARSTTDMVFNKAPLNKNVALSDAKKKVVLKETYDEKVARTSGGAGLGGKGHEAAKGGGFLKKLYEDDDELNDLRVMGGLDEDDAEVVKAVNDKSEANAALLKRKAKALAKMSDTKKTVTQKAEQKSQRIGKLSLKKGTLALFAVCEIASDHLIVNHTRNTKGYVSLRGTPYAGKAHKHFTIGQLIVACVTAEAGTLHTGKDGKADLDKGKRRKLQLSIEPSLLAKSLSAQSVTKNMILQATVEAKEEKGYTCDIGFKDGCKAFLKEEQCGRLKVGQMVNVVVKSVMTAAKILKCELFDKSSDSEDAPTMRSSNESGQPLTLAHVKPGFLVSARVQRVYENGLEMSFAGGLVGNVFADHIENNVHAPSHYKVGSKLPARIISVDTLGKKCTLSLKSHLVALKNYNETDELKVEVARSFDNVTIVKNLYGGSYLVRLGDKDVYGFLHKLHLNRDEESKENENDEDKEERKVGTKLEIEARVKEINYFDGVPMISLKQEVTKPSAVNYQSVKVGQVFEEAIISKVDAEGRFVELKLSEFVTGRLYLEHMAEQPCKLIPAKYQELEKTIKVRVFNVNAEKRLLEFTKKDSLMRDDCPVHESHRDINIGDEITGVVVATNQYGYIVRAFGSIKALLTYEDIAAQKKEKKLQQLRAGSIVKAFCLFKKADKGLALTLSKRNVKLALKALEEKESGKSAEMKRRRVICHYDFSTGCEPEKEKKEKKKKIGKQRTDEGCRVIGKVKTVRKDQLFVQLTGVDGGLALGRLQMIECGSQIEFNKYARGDQIEVKILKKGQVDHGTSWFELTRHPKHMAKLEGLDETQKKVSMLQSEDLKAGKVYKDALILAQPSVSEDGSSESVNLRNSCPLIVQVSPFVRGLVPFDQIVSTQELAQFGSSYLEGGAQKLKAGSRADVRYMGNGRFSMLLKEDKSELEIGRLVTARFIKVVPGKGVSVQLTSKKGSEVYGFIEACEITDEIVGNVFQLVQSRRVFAARIIAQDKQGRWQLSCRESVLDEDLYTSAIGPLGSSAEFEKVDKERQANGNQRNKILKYGASVGLNVNDLTIGYIVSVGRPGCFIQLGHDCVVRAGLNELSDDQDFTWEGVIVPGRMVLGRVTKVEDQMTKAGNEKTGVRRFHFTLRESAVLHGIDDRYKGKKADATPKAQTAESARIKELLQQIEAESDRALGELLKKNEPEVNLPADFDAAMLKNVDTKEELKQQIADLKELEGAESSDEEMDVADDDSDAERIKQLMKQQQGSSDEEDEDMDEQGEDEQSEDDGDAEEDENLEDSSADEDEEMPKIGKKRTLKDRMKEEEDIRKKEKRLRSDTAEPKGIDDFERMLVGKNKEQAFLWLRYMAFMLDSELGVDAARKVAERAIKAIPMADDKEKLNVWTAYMNLESNFGTQETLEAVTKRALELNDRRKVYLNLIDIYKSAMKFTYIEPIYKSLCKKFGASVDLWSGYLEFLVELNARKSSGEEFILNDLELSEPKQVLQKARQALPSDQHVAIISKYGQLEFKFGAPESGRTIFEGIVANYPKRMDIWSIYMDMELKYGKGNETQARHLFERCLSNEHIKQKPKKMKLVFYKYMEFERKLGNEKNVDKLRTRAEQYAATAFEQNEEEDEAMSAEEQSDSD